MPRTAYIANVGSGGLIERNACLDQSRVSGTGWFDGDEITITEVGTGECDGWTRISSNDGRESWVLSEYLSDEQP